MSLISPATWSMSAAQLITPTTSQLSTVNALQAAVTASANWTVNATGVTSLNYKWIELRPTNTQSLYKDYRILVVERVNYLTGRTITGGSSFNTATAVYVHFVPDGGSAWTTFTPGNIESAAAVYVGSKYTAGGGQPQWFSLISPWTALWLYECDGAMWIINRQSGTSCQTLGLGHIYGLSKETFKDYNAAGTEMGVAGAFNRTGIPASNLAGSSFITSANYVSWYDNSGVKQYVPATVSGFVSFSTSTTGGSFSSYDTLGGTALFQPIQFYPNSTSNAIYSPNVLRGVYWMSNVKTRTTVQSGTPAATIGYTWYPDDSANSTLNFAIAFINTP